MAGTIVVDRIESDGSYASTVNVASKVNFTGGMQIGGQDTTFGGRNRIINGAMVIDQRNSGASVNSTDGLYTLDRWRCGASASNAFSVQRSSVSPVGFSNSLLVTSLAATSLSTNSNFEMMQFIEGFNTFDLGWGTANAQTVTISFWVRSSLTGTFGGSLMNATFNRSYPFSYTINSANTFEYKTVTIAGDTSGTWVGATNGIGIVVCFGLGVGTGRSGTAGAWSSNEFYSSTGATSLVGTNGATFQITGVQLEKGSAATAFEYRQYGTELALCQRYYQELNCSPRLNAGACPGNQPTLVYSLMTTMRATPTVSITTTNNYGTTPSSFDPKTTAVGVLVPTNGTIDFDGFFKAVAEL